MTGKEKDNGNTFATGLLFSLLIILIMYLSFTFIFDSRPCDAGRDLLEEARIRIMVEDALSSTNDVCRFATDEGFVLYHDGALYFEVGDGE